MFDPVVVLTANTSWYIYNFRRNLIAALEQAGFKPVILAPEDDYSRKFKVAFKHIRIRGQGKDPFSDLKLLGDYIRLYKRIMPDLILNFTPKPNIYSTLAADKLKIPTINNIAGLGEVFAGRSILNLLVKMLYRYSQPRAEFIFFQNSEDMTCFKKWGILDKIEFDLLPGSGVDVDWFEFSELPKRRKFVFLFLGRLLRKKGVYDFVRAAEIVGKEDPKVEFHILGFPDVDNPGAVSLSEVEDWHKRKIIQYQGNSDDVRPYIKNADCIVLPTYYREGVPRTLLEALSMGRPIITTESTGSRVVVEDNINGMICRPMDFDNLSEVMIRMLKLPYEQRAVMGRKGREKILDLFDEKLVIDKYLKTINQIV